MRGFVLPTLAAAGLLGIVVSATVFEWNECRQVGHGWLYCFLHVGHR